MQLALVIILSLHVLAATSWAGSAFAVASGQRVAAGLLAIAAIAMAAARYA
jgi:hypothetical protein